MAGQRRAAPLKRTGRGSPLGLPYFLMISASVSGMSWPFTIWTGTKWLADANEESRARIRMMNSFFIGIYCYL